MKPLWHILCKTSTMRFLKLFFLLISLCFLESSCSKFGEATQNCMTVTGQIQKQGVTTYQYGTHTIESYALRSSTYDLDEFIIEPNVMIEGCFINGYRNGAVEGGPDYLEVISIEIQ